MMKGQLLAGQSISSLSRVLNGLWPHVIEPRVPNTELPFFETWNMGGGLGSEGEPW